MMRLVVCVDSDEDHNGDKRAVRNLKQCRLKRVETETLDDDCAAARDQ